MIVLNEEMMEVAAKISNNVGSCIANTIRKGVMTAKFGLILA